MEEIDYFSIGSKDEIVISSSSLRYIDPDAGGSPSKFLSFFDKPIEKEENKSLENGSIIHLYQEKPDEFAVSKVPKPDGTIADMAIEFYKLKNNFLTLEEDRLNSKDTQSITKSIGIEITSDLKTENGRSSEILSIKAAYEKLSKLIYPNQDEQEILNKTIILFRLARINTNAYRTYKEDTLINKFISDCIEYLKDLEVLQGKISLTQNDKFTIESCIKSLRENELANKYFNLSGLFEMNPIVKEKAIYFELMGLKCKAKLDNIYIDLDNKTIYLNDLKTTAKPISLFKNTLEFYKYYRQLAFYKRALIKQIKFNNLLVGHVDFSQFKIVCQIIVVETTGNFECQVFNVDEYLPKGEEEIKSLLTRIKFHKDSNQWKRSMEDIQGQGVITLKPE